jgi:iron complex transport system substrate-binding protein
MLKRKKLPSFIRFTKVLSHQLRTFFLYFFIFALLGVWWGCAWKSSTESVVKLINEKPLPLVETDNVPLQEFDRNLILRALRGDVHTMELLLFRWERENQRLKTYFSQKIEDFNPDDLNRFHDLLRILEQKGEYTFSATIEDDNNQCFQSTPYPLKYLAQTYLSAGILLSLLPPERIVAIPSGMRKLSHIYDIQKMNAISLNSEREESEALYMSQPYLAFVADYSQPSMVQAFESQGLKLFYLNAMETPEAILQEIEKVASLVNSPIKGELLSLFVRMAMISIKNHTQCLPCSKSLKGLFIQQTSAFTALSSKNLTVKLFQYLGGENIFENINEGWSFALNKESLVKRQPDIIFVLGKESRDRVLSDLAFNQLEAVKNAKVFALDPDLHYVSDHYFLLSLLDYYECLKTL